MSPKNRGDVRHGRRKEKMPEVRAAHSIAEPHRRRRTTPPKRVRSSHAAGVLHRLLLCRERENGGPSLQTRCSTSLRLPPTAAVD
nr:hypothetical protein Itr_chr02CG11860 [Ipomoea trifida]